jgi:hypothetical protein
MIAVTRDQRPLAVGEEGDVAGARLGLPK